VCAVFLYGIECAWLDCSVLDCEELMRIELRRALAIIVFAISTALTVGLSSSSSASAYAAIKPISAVLIRVDSAHDPETGFYVHVHFRIPTLKANQKYACDISVFGKAKAGKPATLITKWNYQSAGFPPRPAGENMAEANIRPSDVANLGTATLKCVTY
jgi:hypothetical protein